MTLLCLVVVLLLYLLFDAGVVFNVALLDVFVDLGLC